MHKIRTLLVEDAAVIRRLVSVALEEDPVIEVAGTAADGMLALDKVKSLSPDIVVLDIEMPRMNGLETLKALRKTHPNLPIIMFSALTSYGAATTLDSLAAGANDYVTKPGNACGVEGAVTHIKTQLIPKIKSLYQELVQKEEPAPDVTQVTRSSGKQRIDCVCIASSTGGPNALATFLGGLPQSFPAPILIAQHMPPTFTTLLAQRLNSKCPLTVHEAEAGMTVETGYIYIAPGDYHMEVQKKGTGVEISLNQGAQENFCRPAADPLFRSATKVYQSHLLGVVLTGMGHDGMEGARMLVDAGGEVFTQDKNTSVVWGMPRAVTEAKLASQVLPLERMATAVTQRCQQSRGRA